MDFSKPQPFNVDLSAPEMADDHPRGDVIAPAVPYVIPQLALIDPEPDLYALRRGSVVGPSIRHAR